MDGDGVEDIAVGATHDDDGAGNAGAVYILFMQSDGTVKSSQKISATQGNGPTLDVYDYYGWSVAGLGDVDDDGVPDLAVGAMYDDDGSVNAGAVYIHLLHADGTVKATYKISDTSGDGLSLDAYDYF